MFLCAVLFVFTLLAGAFMDDGLGSEEAEALWVVRDDISLNAAPRDALRALRDNVAQMRDRATETPVLLPYYLVLDGWVMCVGESPLAARWLSLLLASLVLALLLRYRQRILIPLFVIGLLYSAVSVTPVAFVILIIGIVVSALRHWFVNHIHISLRWVYPIMVILGAAAAVWSLQAVTGRPDWINGIERLNAQRSAVEPAMTVYAPQHPLAHYDRDTATQVRRWISMDLSWRHFTGDEIAEITGALAGAPAVWVIVEKDDPLADLLENNLAESRVMVEDFQVDDIVFARWE